MARGSVALIWVMDTSHDKQTKPRREVAYNQSKRLVVLLTSFEYFLRVIFALLGETNTRREYCRNNVCTKYEV